MNLILFKSMSSYWLKSAVAVFMFINLCFSVPVPQTLYSSFVADLQKNKCTLPSSISTTNFPNKTAESSLKVCNSNEYLKYNKEVAILCTETFDLFKSIFCLENRPDNVEFTFSQNVCKDLEGYAAVMPEGPLRHLVDHFTCPLLCSEEVQEACQVLWNSLLLTQSKSEGSSITKVQLPSENPATVGKFSKEEIDPDTDPKLTASSAKQEVSEPKVSETKPNDPTITTITKVTNEKSPESEVNPDITHNNNEDSNKSAVNTKAVSEVEKYTVSKAIAEQTPLTINNKLGTSANSSNFKTSPVATDPQNINYASLDLEKPQSQPSDHSNSPTTQTKNTETIVALPELPEQKTNPETTVQQKENVQEETAPEMPKNEPKPSPVADENPDEDDTSPQTVPTTEMKKEESKEAVHTPEEKPTNPKSDQLSEVSESSLSSEPSVVSVPAQKEASSSPASPTPSLEKMEDEIPMPNEKDPDQYTDLENGDGDLDGEYSKQEYGDNGMYEPSKTKETVSESPKSVVPKEPVVSQRDELMDFNRNPLVPSRDSYVRGSEEIQVLATFPSQEDGHFFFYLLTIVLIFMAGYLVFHNKQKIIALIVEGRHERRRRSHGLGYRKLETK